MKETLKEIKHLFFTYRNGIIADTLRANGDNHKIIFGLNLPQIVEIASKFEKNATLANELWTNATSRESQLIAPLLYPIDEFNKEIALQWIDSIPSPEVADILCHKLLRYTTYASQLFSELAHTDDRMKQYTALRLALNLITIGKEIDITILSSLEPKDNRCKSIITAINDALDFNLH
ncbi:MAG: DNA alkylation repair protein [Muribaculaceae bacterium]|nr:DNA alkylation repair protein [Muribaculaceae bacterium]